MNGDERKADLLCAGEQVLSPYPVIFTAPRPALYHPRLGNGEIEVWELVGGRASSGRAGSSQVFPASGWTPHTSLHHPASKARRRKCPGLGRVFPKAWQLCLEIRRELGTPACTFYDTLMTPLICSFYLCQW